MTQSSQRNFKEEGVLRSQAAGVPCDVARVELVVRARKGLRKHQATSWPDTPLLVIHISKPPELCLASCSISASLVASMVAHTYNPRTQEAEAGG